MPADVLGGSVYSQQTGEFALRTGPVFTQRAARRRDQPHHAQDAERAARGDGRAARVDRRRDARARRAVLRDRHAKPAKSSTARIRCRSRSSIASCCACASAIRRPEVERQVLARRRRADPVDELHAVVDQRDLLAAQSAVDRVRVSDEVLDYLHALVLATRNTPLLSIGASTRAAIALERAVRALALTCRAHATRSPTTSKRSASRCSRIACDRPAAVTADRLTSTASASCAICSPRCPSRCEPSSSRAQPARRQRGIARSRRARSGGCSPAKAHARPEQPWRRLFRTTREGKALHLRHGRRRHRRHQHRQQPAVSDLRLHASLIVLSGILSEIALRGLRVSAAPAAARVRRQARAWSRSRCRTRSRARRRTRSRSKTCAHEAADRAPLLLLEGRAAAPSRSPATTHAQAPRARALRGFRVATRYPFGIIEKWRVIEAEEELLVYPALLREDLRHERRATALDAPTTRVGVGTRDRGPARLSAGRRRARDPLEAHGGARASDGLREATATPARS